MFTHFDRERIVWESALPANEKLLLLALNSFVDANGECWPGQELLARMCGFTDRTIRNLCLSLEAKRIIQRSHRQDKQGFRSSDKFKIQFSIIPSREQRTLSKNASARSETLPENDDNSYRKMTTSLPENTSARSEVLPENDDRSYRKMTTILPENDDRSYRKMTTILPETFSGDLSSRSIQIDLSSRTIQIDLSRKDPPLPPKGELPVSKTCPKTSDSDLEPIQTTLPLSVQTEKPSKRSTRKKAKNKPLSSDDAKIIMACYNAHKPSWFADCEIGDEPVGKRRLGVLQRLVNEHGDRTLDDLEAALNEMKQEVHWRGRILTLENVVTNGKVRQKSEAWRSRQKASQSREPMSFLDEWNKRKTAERMLEIMEGRHVHR